MRVHDLRHLFATNALADGMDIKTLSTILGHRSSSTTLNICVHVTDAMRKTSAVNIDQGIAKVEPLPEAGNAQADHSMTTFRPESGGRKNRLNNHRPAGGKPRRAISLSVDKYVVRK